MVRWRRDLGDGRGEIAAARARPAGRDVSSDLGEMVLDAGSLLLPGRHRQGDEGGARRDRAAAARRRGETVPGWSMSLERAERRIEGGGTAGRPLGVLGRSDSSRA
jgi:hypothetical protein